MINQHLCFLTKCLMKSETIIKHGMIHWLTVSSSALQFSTVYIHIQFTALSNVLITLQTQYRLFSLGLIPLSYRQSRSHSALYSAFNESSYTLVRFGLLSHRASNLCILAKCGFKNAARYLERFPSMRAVHKRISLHIIRCTLSH